jgi:hypothetical protein
MRPVLCHRGSWFRGIRLWHLGPGAFLFPLFVFLSVSSLGGA